MAIWLSVILGLVVICLAARIIIMKKSAREIREQLREKLSADTNTLIDISDSDRDMRELAAALNRELAALRAEQRRYMQGSRELNEAITNISHDLRTPLTAVCGYLDLLEKCPQTDEARQYLAQIANRTAAMRTLTEELFRYSLAAAETAPVLERLCVNELLEESLASFYGAISERGITPEIAIPEERISLITDRSALTRVFSNLLSNALKYSLGDLRVALTQAERRVVITFANTAANIGEIAVHRLFDRFYTVEDGNTSTGLGLSIAKLLVEKLGGTISAEIDGEKLVIQMELPLTS